MVSFVTRLFLPGAFCVFFFWASRTHSTASGVMGLLPADLPAVVLDTSHDGFF